MRKYNDVANVGIGEAWEIISLDSKETPTDQRRLRCKLIRQYRKRRRPFTQEALDAFIGAALQDYISKMPADGNPDQGDARHATN